MKELKSRPLFDISITLHPIQEIGKTPAGERRVIPVSGGEFSGERLRGEVLPHAGSDLLLLRADGSFQQDVRLSLRTDDGALILMTYRGVRYGSPEVNQRIARGEQVAPSDYYLRIAAVLRNLGAEVCVAQHHRFRRCRRALAERRALRGIRDPLTATSAAPSL